MIHTIKHCSIDLWYSLIKSNPVFKAKRALYFYEKVNTKNKSLEQVEATFRKIDLMCNAINEKTGNNICAEEMYGMVIYLLNDSMLDFEKEKLAYLYEELETLFFQFSPILFNEQTIPTLQKLKKTKTLSILSNTAFIKASSLRKLLSNLNIEQYFSFQIYSDEVGFSKPNQAIFKLMIYKINLVHNGILNKQILHIGDNPLADIEGAKALGINTFLINSNDKIIANIFD